MPAITSEAKIDVRAPANVAFEVVAEDILRHEQRLDSMIGQRPLDEGPLRTGFRWRQTLVHERRQCHSDWTVTELQPGRVLEQTMLHFCFVALREVRGGERWEFVQAADGTTLVTLRAWRLKPGLAGWLEKVLGSPLKQRTSIDLRKRLAHVQFQAERPAELF
jgi:hypothetical protein